ncbi:MAG TPA: tetratricopeptide repeat protein [Thermoanaerobaculia bacterium]|nr:tetratricopeptide repeat protein [Thermoanaerobaculia bacterium]
MKASKIAVMICIVALCAVSVAAQDARDTIANLEKSVAEGTATRADQLRLARAYSEVGRHHEARKLAQRLADQDPSDTDAIAIRDRAAEQLNAIASQRVQDAEAAMKRPDATAADRQELADAYFAAGRYRDASKIYADLPDRSYDVRLRHARSLSWAGQHDAAEMEYAKLMAERPSPELELEYGKVLSWMGAERASIERLQSAHRASNSEETAIALANAHAWSGNREEAVRLLTDFTASNTRASEARALLDQMRSSPDLRIERLDRMIEADEFNLALRAERARLHFDAGHYSRAIKDVEFVRKNANGEDVPDLSDLERQARERRREEIAKLDEKRRAMEASGPMTSSVAGSAALAEQQLELAKAYTGLGEHDQAIELYDAYLDTVPEDTTARLNYARVLSWDQRYDQSQKQYEIVLRAHPDRADVRLEYAQALSYDGEYVPALSTLSELTAVSDSPRAYLYPDVPQQAHFRRGQIYRWYGWNDHAIAEQNRALGYDSTFGDAQRELARVRTGRPGSMLQARYTTENNSSDFHMRRTDLEAEHWLDQRLAVQGSIGRHNFDQRDVSANANVASVGGLWRQTDQLTFRGRVGATFWDQGLGTRPFMGLGAVWLPNIQSRFALDYNHYDLVYDVSNLFTLNRRIAPTDEALSINDFRAHYDHDTGGRLSFLADASYGLISDDNNRMAGHGLVSFRVLDSPFVALKADGRVLSYDFRSNRYWSPDDYSSLAGVVQVGQDIADRVFWTLEFKAGRAWEGDRSSDIRAWGARVTVPVADTFDVIGAYNYGRSGRFESLIGAPEFTNYWQRSWYVGVRLKRLFTGDDNRARDRYYFDNRVLGSDIIPPEVR